MLCDQCAMKRGLAEGARGSPVKPVNTVEGVRVGCFPDLYAARAAPLAALPDHIITLESADRFSARAGRSVLSNIIVTADSARRLTWERVAGEVGPCCLEQLYRRR